MRRVFTIAALLLLLVIVALAALPFLLPAGLLKTKLLAQIEHATGRNVQIGEVHVSVFPDIALSAADVHIGNPAWAGGGDMVNARGLRVTVELMPLLQRDVHIKELTLDAPVILLIKKGDTANWLFPDGSGAAKPAAPMQATSSAPTRPFSFDGFTLNNASITYKDSASGTITITEANAHFTASSLLHDVHFKGDALYNGKKAAIAFSAGKPFEALSGTASTIDIKASYGDFSLSWQGTAAMQAGVPVLTGAVAIPVVDDRPQPQAPSETASAPAAAPKAGARPAAAVSASHWSDAPVSFAALKKLNADLTFTISKLILPATTLQDVNFHLRLHNGNAAVTTEKIAAYGGTLQTAVSVTAPSGLALDTTITDVQAAPLLHDFARSDAFAGTLSAHIKVNAAGGSERAMIGTLAGNGNFSLRNGEFKGRNIAGLMRGLNASGNAGGTTPFTQGTGTFTIAQGILANHDLRVDAGTLQITGDGTVDLPAWQVHYTLKPLLVAAQAAGNAGASGISVPVLVEGSLDSPSYRPDLKAALQENLKDPALLKQNLKQLNKKLINRDTLRQLLGR